MPQRHVSGPTAAGSAGRLVYSVYEPHESLCLFEEDEARSLARETAAIKACATVGALRALAPTLKSQWVPIDEEQLEQLPDDEPWDWTDAPAVGEGDWPRMPTSNALRLFPDGDLTLDDLMSIQGVEIVATTLNGDYLALPVELESEVVAVLRSHGWNVRRDDAMLQGLLD